MDMNGLEAPGDLLRHPITKQTIDPSIQAVFGDLLGTTAVQGPVSTADGAEMTKYMRLLEGCQRLWESEEDASPWRHGECFSQVEC